RVARRHQLVDEAVERIRLMFVRGERGLAHACEETRERFIGIDPIAEDERVDEAAGDVFEIAMTAAGDRRADREVALAARAMQQRLDRREERDEDARAVTRGHVAEALRDVRTDIKRERLPFERLRGRTREIGRQFERLEI